MEAKAQKHQPLKTPGNRWAFKRGSCLMKLRFSQSGGYAGLCSKVDEIDTALLPEQEAQHLRTLVEQSGILKTEEKCGQGADIQRYDFTVETSDGKRQVSFDDLTLPEKALPLLEYLQSKATFSPPGKL